MGQLHLILHVYEYQLYVYKVCYIKNNAKCNLNAINLGMNSWKKYQNKSPNLERTNVITKYTSQ